MIVDIRIKGVWVKANIVGILPDQAGHAGEFLSTNGSEVGWNVAGGGGGLSEETVIAYSIAL